MAYEFKEWNWKENRKVEGVYLLLFKNGMNYLGSSKDIRRRFTQHMREFFSDKCNDWHKAASREFTKDTMFKNIEFLFLETEDYKGLEEKLLKEIKENGFEKKYYNKVFGGSKELGQMRAKKVLCIETGEIFNSITKAAEWAKTVSSHISECCNNKRKEAGNYHWQFAEVD